MQAPILTCHRATTRVRHCLHRHPLTATFVDHKTRSIHKPHPDVDWSPTRINRPYHAKNSTSSPPDSSRSQGWAPSQTARWQGHPATTCVQHCRIGTLSPPPLLLVPRHNPYISLIPCVPNTHHPTTLRSQKQHDNTDRRGVIIQQGCAHPTWISGMWIT